MVAACSRDQVGHGVDAPIVAAVRRGEAEEGQKGQDGHHEDGPHQRVVELAFSHRTTPITLEWRRSILAMVDLRREMPQLVAGITPQRGRRAGRAQGKDDDMTDKPVQISGSQVSLILQRAAEIDAKGDTMTVEELRRIAAEAGIDAGATNRAIREIMTGEEPDPQPESTESPGVPAKRSTSPSTPRILAGGAIGTAMGFLAAFAGGGAASTVWPMLGWLGFGGTILYLVARAVESMKRGAQLDFQLQNLVLWFGVSVGALATDLLWADEILTVAILVWFLTSVLGGLLVRFGPKDEDGDDPTRQIGPGGG